MAGALAQVRAWPKGAKVTVAALAGLVVVVGAGGAGDERSPDPVPVAQAASPAATTTVAPTTVVPTTVVATTTSTTTSTTTTTAPPTTAPPATAPPATAPPSTAPPVTEAPVQAFVPAPTPDGAVSFANCDAVRAAGRAPIRRGEPGFEKKFDGDGDGVGCEVD